MLSELAEIYDNGGCLLGVKYSLFEGDPRFVTAVALQFENLFAVFRAIADDDTVGLMIGPLEIESDERLIDASGSAPWSACIGLNICNAWQLTIQQGYVDGVRLEFNRAGQSPNPVVELIVMASAMKIFVLSNIASEQALGADSPGSSLNSQFSGRAAQAQP
jgi:hypothetical protein